MSKKEINQILNTKVIKISNYLLGEIRRFQNELSILQAKIVNLMSSKETIEKFYQNELKICLKKLEEKTQKIDELIGKNYQFII